MKRPSMIIFDYGHTLYNEENYDASKGSKAVLDIVTDNPYDVSVATLVEKAAFMNRYIGRYEPDKVRDYLVEVHNLPFSRYLYEYYDLKFDCSLSEVETVFWNHAAPGQATPHIQELLSYLNNVGIRTAVISNLSFSGEALVRRISQEIDVHQFEFILSTADYLFRKPSALIYELALRKAKLNPEDVWYCGDNVYCDVEGAFKAGIQPIWYKGVNATGVYNGSADRVVRPVSPDCDHIVIGSWLEIIELLKKS